MLSGDTLLLTHEGWKPLVKIMAGGKTITDAQRYTFKLARGTSEVRWEVVSGRPHKWPFKGPVDHTYDLRKGDVVPAIDQNAGYDGQGWLHGYLKRQGFTSGTYTLPTHLNRFKNRLREFAEDTWTLTDAPVLSTRMKFRDYPFVSWPYELKDVCVDAKYISSFVSGFLEGAKETDQLQTTDATAAQWLFDHAPFAGYIGSGVISTKRVATQTSRVNAPDFHDVFCFQMIHGRDHAGFRVEKIEPIEGATLCWWRSETKPVCISGGISAFL